MSQGWLFGGEEGEKPELAGRLGTRLKKLAEQGVYFGTSSWKYPGWLGSVYTEERYKTRGRFSQKKFEAECLREYAETFPVVGGDFSFYQFPSDAYWSELFRSSPERLLFGLKVPENVTVHTWPPHARYGARAGGANEEFLNAEVLKRRFLGPLEAYSDRVAVLLFEFGAFPKFVFASPEEFLARLDGFLSSLGGTFRCAVEIRNPEYLGMEYFQTLSRHNVAHVFSAWTRMPEMGEQMELPGAFTADFSVARALLSRGRTYEQAVQKFEPYREVQEPHEKVRSAMVRLANSGLERRKPTFLLVNNRLEGNAPGTIEAVVNGLGTW